MPGPRPATIFPYMTQTEIHRDLISLIVNGQPRQFSPGTTIADLLDQLGLHPRAVVVELNRSILKDRGQFTAIVLGEGDNVELVHFVGGG
jgi:thiamine biosynthesis protein ThiS